MSGVVVRVGQNLDAVAYGPNGIRAGLPSRREVCLQQFVYEY